MFRRSRFSVRPNVGASGRTAAAPQEAPLVNQKTKDTTNNIAPDDADTAVAMPSENLAAQGDGNDQIAEANASSLAVQRRKRFSVKPKVIPGRPSVLARATKSPVKATKSPVKATKSPVKAARSPVKAGHETPLEVPEQAEDGTENASQSLVAPAPRGLQSPRRRRSSEDSQEPKIQPQRQPHPVSSDSSAAETEDLQDPSHQSADVGKQLETTSEGQAKESHFKVPETVPPSLPRKDVTEISVKARTLVSAKIGVSTSAAAFSLSRLVNDPSDLHRLAKARKLRELLKEEAHKDRRLKKSKLRSKEFTLDPAKMTMRDLIHYLPESNPMKSCLEFGAPEDETVISPPSETEDPPDTAQEPAGSQREEEQEAEGDQDEALLVPRVKVAEDGSLIIDESSLTVEVQRAKGPNLIQDRDPIFERGSTTTYSSFRKGSYSKPWSSEETDMFFLAVSMVGTDFTMICQLFPHRARSEIKNKFKKEERQNSWRVDKAFRERRKLDIEYFSKLLEMILEVQKNRKKHKSLAKKNGSKKKRRKRKGKRAQQKLSDVEEEEEDEIPDMEEDKEEENADLCSESQFPVTPPKNQRKRRRGQDATTDAPGEGKRDLRDDGEGEKVCIREDAEASHLPNDADMPSGEAPVKPDKPPPGRAARPLPCLNQKRPPSPSAASKNDTCGEAHVSVNAGATEEQGKKRKLADDDVSSDEDAAKCQRLKPTRYGRMPKPTKPLTYPTTDDAHSSPSEATPASPREPSAPRPRNKGPAKKIGKTSSVQEPKRPKLITLRASQSEYSDDDGDENHEWAGPEQQLGCASSGDSAAAFVPASLCFLHPVSVEVEETMEELDILASMPDVFGISQDALRSEVKTVENETCSGEPRERQLDLLVDVIDCLPSEYTVSEEESYNEAAQTLLTISNMHGATSAKNPPAVKDQAEAVGVDERALETDQASASVSGNGEMSTQGVADAPDSNTEPQNGLNDAGDATSTGDQKTEPPQLPPSPEKPEEMSSLPRRSRMSKIKPTPVLRASRAARSKPQPGTSTEGVESRTATPSCSGSTELPSTAEANKTQMSQTPLSNGKREEKVPEVVAAAGGRENEESARVKRSLEPMTTGDILTPRPSDIPDLASATGASGSDLNRDKDSAAIQKEEDKNGSAPHTRKSRFQKAKPNLPTTPRAARSRSQITQDPAEKSAERDISSSAESQDLVLESVPSEKVSTDLRVQPLSSIAASDPITSGHERTPEISLDSHMGEVETSAAVAFSDPSALCRVNTEDPAVCQRGSMESSSAKPVRKGRFQKVKPKPNLASTTRSAWPNPTSTNNGVNANSSPPSTPQSREGMVGEAGDPPVITSPVGLGEGSGSGSGLMPTPDPRSSLTATEDSVMTEAGQTGVGVEGEMESSVDQSAPQNRDLHVQPEEEAARAADPTQKTGELSEAMDPAAPVAPEPDIMTPHDQASLHPPPSGACQEGAATPCQTRKGQRLKPKPNLAQTSRRAQSNPQSAEEAAAAALVGRSSSPGPLSSDVSASRKDQISRAAPAGTMTRIPETEAPSAASEPCPPEKPVTDASLAEDQGNNVGSSECPAKNEPQRRQCFPKAKPSLGSNIPAKVPPSDTSKASEQQHVDATAAGTPEQHTQMLLQPIERDGEYSTSMGIAIGDNRNNEVPISVRVAMAIGALAENQPARKGSNPPPSGEADMSQVWSSGNVSPGTEMKSVSVESTPGVTESPQQASSEHKSSHTHPPETAKASSSAQSSRGDQSEPGTSPNSTKVLTRRGRLVRPKPNLGHNSRSKQIQMSTRREEDSGGSDASKGCPIGGAVGQQSAAADTDASSDIIDHLDQPHADPSAAGPPLARFDEAPSYTQDLTTSSAVGNQIPADFTVFSDMLSGQVPADPDEAFFILSLTEIPLCSLREMADGTSEPLPQQSVSGECSDEPPAHVGVSTEQSALVTVGGIPPDLAAHNGSDLDNPADPHETPSAEPSIPPAAEHWHPEPRRRRSQSTAAKGPRKKKSGSGASDLPGSPPERGHLGNVTPGGGTDAEAGSSGACIHAPSNGSPCDERRRSPAETASVPPPATPRPAEEDAELISNTEEKIRAEHSSPQDEEPPTSVSQYFLSDIFTEVEDE